jgi:hypothetical protein
VPETAARIRAAGSALVVPALAALFAWLTVVASNERTVAGRLELAKTELARERERNAAAHAASLTDRTSTKGFAASNAREIAAIRADVAALRAELGRIKKGAPGGR